MIQAIAELKKLPFHERLQLVEDLWDSLAEENAQFELPDWQKAELDRRHKDFLKNPNSGIPWVKVKDQIHRDNV